MPRLIQYRIIDLKGEIGEEKYLIDDMTGDHVPELVIRADGRYDILTYRSGRLFVLWILSSDDYVLLEGGQVLYRSI